MGPQHNLFVRASLLLILSLSPAALSRAQTQSAKPAPDKTSTIKVQTTLVLIPATVTDRNGKRIDDLGENEFEILRDGKVQRIGLFRHVHTSSLTNTASPGVPSNGDASNISDGVPDTRFTIFVIDSLNSSVNERQTQHNQFTQFLSKNIALKEPLCLLSLDQNGLSVLHDFTTDPTALLAALNGSKTPQSPKDKPEQNAYDDNFRGVAGWVSRSMSRNMAMQSAATKTMEDAEELRASDNSFRTSLTLEALRLIGNAFSAVPGRKSLVWSTGGFPFDIDDAKAFDKNQEIRTMYERAWKSLNRANIAFYPLDVEDLTDPSYTGPGSGSRRAHMGVNLTVVHLESFAEATGGQFCDRRQDAESCLQQAVADSTDYYLLGIYTDSADQKPGWKSLSVRVVRPDAQVRARHGYYEPGPSVADPTHSADEDINLALASPVNYTAVPFRIHESVESVALANGKKQVDFTFVIAPGIATIDDANDNHLDVDFVLLVRDSKGAPAGTFSQRIERHLSTPVAADVRKRGLNYFAKIELPRGDFTFVFGVRDNITEAMGTLSVDVKVP